MNWLIILANMVVFGAQSVYGPAFNHFELSPRQPQLIQFFTYQFMHGSPMHIAGNMLFLYIFGNNVNDKMGQLGYLAFYLAGGIFAGICYVLTQHGAAPVLGASGAVAAITGAYLVLFPRSYVTIVYFFFFIGMFELQSMWFILMFFGMDIILSGTGDTVAHMAHIGGTIFGSSICLLMLIPQLLPRDQFDVWALIQRWNKRRQYRDLVAGGFDPFSHVVQGRKRIPDAVLQEVQMLRAQISESLAKRDVATAADIYLRLKSVDPEQVMSKQAQMDIATHFHHEGKYAQAAEAYEQLLKTYSSIDRVEQVELMVGLIYARYLNQYDRAKQHLQKAIARLHEGKEMELARQELSTVELNLATNR